MSELTLLKRFLESHRISDKSVYNFVCLHKKTGIFRQGRFYIPESKRADFWKLYKDAAPYFSEANCPSITYRPPTRQVQPLTLDIDLQFEHETILDPSINFKFTVAIANKLAEIAKQSVNFYIISKPKGYFYFFKSKNK